MDLKTRIFNVLLKHSTIVMFVIFFVLFSIMSARFFSLKNMEIILGNSTYIGLVAIGMTFVLLIGGIDLSVGSTMYFSVVVMGVLIENDWPITAAIIVCLLVGLAVGAFNAVIITVLNFSPFLATLITMLIVRGAGLWISKSKAINYPESITKMSTYDVFGLIPMHIFIFALMLLITYVYLEYAPWGRHLYAIGNNEEISMKAGIRVKPLMFSTYTICGLMAAMGGLVAITRLGRANANFGSGEEFNAIAAAVLGGVSLFGGVGNIFPGTFIGIIMIQMVQAGLVYINVDIYLHSIIMALIIFLAVFIDSIKTSYLQGLKKKNIMKLECK